MLASNYWGAEICNREFSRKKLVFLFYSFTGSAGQNSLYLYSKFSCISPILGSYRYRLRQIFIRIGVEKTIISVNYNCRRELGAQRNLWVCGIIDLIVSTCSMSREIYYGGRNNHIFQGHNIGPFCLQSTPALHHCYHI